MVKMPRMVKMPGRSVRFRAQVPCPHACRFSETETNSSLCGGEGVCRVKKEETRKCQTPLGSMVGLSFPFSDALLPKAPSGSVTHSLAHQYSASLTHPLGGTG